MPDREKVIKGLNNIGREIVNTIGHVEAVPYLRTIDDAIDLLKEQEAMNVDAFVQWCFDSHIMGDAIARGIKYWVEEYKKTKEGR